MSSELNKFEAYQPAAHDGMLMAALLEGCDTRCHVEGAERMIVHGKTKHGLGPIGVVDLVSTPYINEPHVAWFPWTTPAAKIQAFKWAMKLWGKDKRVVLYVKKDQTSFFDHFVKNGLLRHAGYLEDIPLVEEIHIYQYNRRTEQ